MYWIEWFVYMLSFTLFEKGYIILSTVFLLPTTSLVFSTLWKNLLMQRRWMRLEKLPKVFLFLRLILESFGSEQKEKRTRLNSDLGKSNLNFCERNIFFPNIQNWLWAIFITKWKNMWMIWLLVLFFVSFFHGKMVLITNWQQRND